MLHLIELQARLIEDDAVEPIQVAVKIRVDFEQSGNDAFECRWCELSLVRPLPRIALFIHWREFPIAEGLQSPDQQNYRRTERPLLFLNACVALRPQLFQRKPVD